MEVCRRYAPSEPMEATLVYPHQLFRAHPGVKRGRPVWLVEDPLFFGTDAEWPVAMHRQKLVLHMASMSAYAEELLEAGHEVRWVRLNGGEKGLGSDLLRESLPGNLREVHVADVVDDVLRRRLETFAARGGIRLVWHESPNFLTPMDFLARHTGTRLKRPFMARFYEAQRKRMGVLLDEEGGPVGGRWSFDEDNRKKWPARAVPPLEPWVKANTHVQAAIRRVQRDFPHRPGFTDGFRWAVTREDAEAWLERFWEERFAGFGPYEDAISTRHGFLHHSAITPMLNIGLLDPAQVVSGAIAAAEKHGVPLASLEGFLRQVIGWREFMRGIYQFRSVPVRTTNHFGFSRKIPMAFYDGTTGIAPVDRVIRQLLREGYCHHIERLMVLGCFMLLCRFDPDEVYRWFMEMFVDAYDWVMVPNVYGMSQFADGGTFTTKPYLCGSNYLLKMSDEPKGGWCAVWDALYWVFIADHGELFRKNPRLAMMTKTWERMDEGKKKAHRSLAKRYLGEGVWG